jgi:hypothetical protein
MTGLRLGAGSAFVEMPQDLPFDRGGRRDPFSPPEGLTMPARRITTLDWSLPNRSVCCGLRR